MEKVLAMATGLVALLLVAGAGPAEGAVYKVGDSAGWTIMGSPNYTAWAASKTFHVGDTIVFEYNNSFHNVLEVTKAEYNACNASSPIATYATGNDSITIKTKGHHYFLCGFPGHCTIGQKVDIYIPKSSSAAPSTSPAAAPSPSSGSSSSSSGTGGIPTPAAAPRPSAGTKPVPQAFALVLAVFSFVAVAGGLVRQ
uniref:Phytocyanin domain-containing protein n=1 Tax=Musa acuminata subsp. malaccensis TaxID=214687 RepID=A0A804KI78_MUSAM|nr:PREDICTED: mavicyanin [Musa acuminata subsp. malaccensis]